MTRNEFLFSGKGRTSRKDYWLKYVLPMLGVMLVVVLVGVALYLAMEEAAIPILAIIGIPLYIVVLWIGCAVSARRFHDRGMSGWYVALFIAISIVCNVLAALPNEMIVLIGSVVSLIAGIIQFVILGCLPGQKGPNQYGDDPLNPSDSIAETFE